ncbi:MAG: TonB family protein [Sphingomonas sp.]
MVRFFAALAMLAASMGGPTGPKPKYAPATWFPDDFYPARAIMANAQGQVTVVADVSVEGRVVACRVAGSSGNMDLDTGTCALLTHYGRFLPATDSGGKPVPGRWATSVTWKLPTEEPPPPPSQPVDSRWSEPDDTLTYQVLYYHESSTGEGFPLAFARLPLGGQRQFRILIASPQNSDRYFQYDFSYDSGPICDRSNGPSFSPAVHRWNMARTNEWWSSDDLVDLEGMFYTMTCIDHPDQRQVHGIHAAIDTISGAQK